MITAKLHEPESITFGPSLVRCTLDEAAAALGVSRATVRRAANDLGVKRFRGRLITGYVVFTDFPTSYAVPFTDDCHEQGT